MSVQRRGAIDIGRLRKSGERACIFAGDRKPIEAPRIGVKQLHKVRGAQRARRKQGEPVGASRAWRGIGLANNPFAGIGLAQLSRLATTAGKAESWINETLGDDGRTTEQNESSVVLFVCFNGTGVLLTGDAGRAGLLAQPFPQVCESSARSRHSSLPAIGQEWTC